MADQPVSSAELKKLRTPVRAMFTKAFNELETEIKKKEVKKADVEKILRRLQTHHEKLLILNMRVEEALLRESASEDIFTAEYESVCEYEDNFSNIMTDYEALAKKDDDSTISGTAAMNYRLPKLEFKKFGGKPREWITFWSQFSTIDRDPQMPPETKFQYLFQATAENSEAREAVESFPPSADNYPKVIEYIKSRFGEDEMLVEIYVRDLLQNVLQNVRAEGKMSVVKLYDRLETQLRALETLGVARDKFAAMLYPLVESALPEDTLRVWERSQHTVSGRGVQDKLTQLMTFLKTEVKGESRVNMAKAAFKIDNNQDVKDDRSNRKSLSKKNTGSKMPTATDLANTTQMRNNCIFCGKGHPSQECYSGQRMYLPEKKDRAKGKNVCFWCLLPGHGFKKCQIKPRCPVCGGKHYPIMCPTLEAQKTSHLQKAELKASRESPATEQETANQLTSTTVNNATVGGVYLQTLIVKISGPKGRHNVRVLLDCGSQRSYISKRMVDALGLKRVQQVTLTHNLFGGGEIRQKKHNVYKVNVSSLNSEYMDDLKFLDQEVICGHISQVQDHTILNELKARGINLTDICQGEEISIHMLIGSDLLSSILTGRMQILQNGVVATETKLGWTVMGPAIGKYMEDSCLIVTSLHVNSFDVQDLWKLDVLGIMDAAETKSRKDLIEASNTHFKETVKRDESGRYIVSLPWIAGHPPVPVNRRTTENRLLTTTRNVQDKMLYEKYDTIFEEWEKERFIEEVEDKWEGCGYLPHRPVLRDGRTTPIRPVFDASCKKKGLPSLNQCLEKGDNLIELIPDLLLRFRLGKYGIIADIRQAFLQIQESSDIMMQAKFELRDWMWNEPGIPEQDLASILGMKWHLQTDTIAINVQSLKNIDEEKSITKRSILSACHRIFDPIQFTCPATIKIKKMVQDAWKENKSWDEPLNEDRRVEFIKWREQALELDRIKIPRWILPIKGRTTLHVFCDASAIAYATVIFMRIENASVIVVRFVEARNRLATIKRITIPRLELLACLIGARLLVHVLENLEESPEKIQCWTDSSPALYWIHRCLCLLCSIGRLGKNWFLTIQQQENWAQFVSNRVKEITTLTKSEDWNHVAGEHNPADLPSRGESPSKFTKSGWWEGPKWLQEKKEDWPVSKVQYDLEVIEEERRKTVVTGFVAKKPEENPWYLNLYEGKREVTLPQILRVIAWMLRFKPSEYKGDIISQEELDSAEKSLVKIIQNESIGEEDPKMKQLHAFQDKEGLWRVKTRIVNRNDDELFRLPILIPTNHPVTKLIVKSVHEKMYHCGAQTLRSVLREKFWIPKARQLVRHVIHKCPRCRRFETKRVDVPEASLPQHRVRDVVVFEVTGIDLGGPLYLEDGQKVWFVIFTCGVYRAVHLELVTSLSTEALVGAVERFVARRGCPAVIYSDNGTNLVGLQNELYRVNFGVKWKLNPSAAPWWGGWIERIVGLTKKLLRGLLGKRVVNYEEMVTILGNCERVINARPLTYIAEDNDDLVPLTPEMFLREPRTEGEIDLNEFRCNFGKSYEKRKRLLKEFRKRFRSEYLGLLVHHDNRRKQRQLKVGDIVLVEVENRKQINWPMGKITRVFPGTDNVRRLVEVKTKSGFMKRAVQRLFPLEVPTEDVEQDDRELKPAEDEIVREKTTGVESVSVQEKTTPVKVGKVYTRSGRRVKLPIRISEHCEYANLREELIRDRIVLGVKDRKLSEKLMLNENLTLAKAVEIARQWEAVMREQQDLNPSTSQVDTTRKVAKQKPKASGHGKNNGRSTSRQTDSAKETDEGKKIPTCFNCGTTKHHYRYRDKCPIDFVINGKTDVNPEREFPKLFEGLGLLEQPYHIKLKEGAKPFSIPVPRRVPLPPMPKLKEQQDAMVAQEVIEPVYEPTEWCAPIVLAGKPSGKIRICVDLSWLNLSVERELHPLPVLEHELAQLNGAKIFSRLDANSGFWQIKLSEESQTLTTFITPFGRYKFKRLPFGISSAPEHFQKRMSAILRGVNGVICHMDDILIFAKRKEEHDETLREVLRRLKNSGITLNKEKCQFGVSNVTFLGITSTNTVSRRMKRNRCASSSYGLGAVLKQEHEANEWRPVAFASRTLTKTEQGYAQIEKEALAITWACERFKDFVVGKTFLIETDHKPLVPIFTTKDLNDLTPRLQRYRMRMLQFSFHIFHTPGKDLITADALSRQPLPGHLPEDEELQEEVEHFVRSIVLHQSTTDDRLAKIALNQKLEPTLQNVAFYSKNGWPAKCQLSPLERSFYDVRDEIGEENGLLMRGLRVVRLTKLYSEAVVDHCKAIFARHGIPDIVINYNGPQFRPSTTSAFTKFASEVGFRHITSSPKHPQSNGQAEAAVKIVKSLMKKNKDPVLALMEYRATPLANGLSPAELLFGRKIRTMVPCTSSSLTPKTVDQSKLRREEEQRKMAQKTAFDRRYAATKKAELIAGEKVW
ncbi:hypothetical protein LAZ67_20002653, partial [Cordylochernes scorpioides]